MCGVVFLLGCNSQLAFASDIDSNESLPQTVINIAEGSDEIYDTGATIIHGENPKERYKSGGIDHTHQYIAASSLVILNNDKGSSIFNDLINSALLMEGADWPDVWGNQTDYMTFSGHFFVNFQ